MQQRRDEHNLPFRTILERNIMRLINHANLPFGPVLEWNCMRKFYHTPIKHFLLFGTILGRDSMRAFLNHTPACFDFLPLRAVLEWDKLREFLFFGAILGRKCMCKLITPSPPSTSTSTSIGTATTPSSTTSRILHAFLSAKSLLERFILRGAEGSEF
jgi:hypothetical protein